jgi:hypothetical protein
MLTKRMESSPDVRKQVNPWAVWRGAKNWVRLVREHAIGELVLQAPLSPEAHPGRF